MAIPRAGNLFWTLRRSVEAEAVLDAAESTAVDQETQGALTAMRCEFDASLGRPRPAVEAGMQALATPSLADQAVIMVACGMVGAGAVLGQMDMVRRIAPLGYEAAARSFDAGIMKFGLSDLHILALRLSGDVRETERIARERRAESVNVPGPPQLMGLVLLGQAALAAGRVRRAARWLREARAGLTSVATHEFQFRCPLHLTQALAIAGEATAARQMLTELEAERHPAYGLMEPDTVLARAWVAAAEGATTEAVAVARRAAELAGDRDAPAYEVLALQTVVCLGDATVADRLAELADWCRGRAHLPPQRTPRRGPRATATH